MDFPLRIGNHHVGWSPGGTYVVVVEHDTKMNCYAIHHILTGAQAKICYRLLQDSGLIKDLI